MPSGCLLSVEDQFGPIVTGCGTDFDFTLLFEEAILFILPLCVASVLAISRIAFLWTQPAIVRHGFLLPLKLVGSLFYLVDCLCFSRTSLLCCRALDHG